MDAVKIGDDLRAVIDGLLRHHELVVSGLAGGQAEDDLLDETERNWHRLTPAEKRQVAAVSEALLTAEDDVDTEPPLATGEQAQATEELLRRAPNAAEKLLILCREPSPVPRFVRAYYRSRFLSEMGFGSAAAVLRQRALALADSEPEHKLALVIKLSSDGLTDDLLEALRSAATQCEDPSALLGAGELLLRAAVLRGDAELAHTANNVHERALRDPGQLDSHLLAAGLANWATVYKYLGDRSKARELFDQAVRVEPTNGNLLHARGVLRYEEDPADVEDLRQAVSLHAASPWPYLLLAEIALARDDPEACRQLAERSLQMSSSPAARAVARDLLAQANGSWAEGSAAMVRALTPTLPATDEELIMAVA
jgi:tetratricopeptide (TPR) repeat protein